MTTYPLSVSDIELLKEIHEKYYKNEFSFPDFSRNFLVTFKILDQNKKFICAGGVKLFPELILITDKEQDARNRYLGLMTSLQIAELTAFSAGHNNLFAAAPKGSDWERNLIKAGFRNSTDNQLVIG